MIALVGFAATANFKTPGKPQISKSECIDKIR